MSRTRQTEQSHNPASLFLRWSSDLKVWEWYDKEEKIRKPISKETPFIVLDALSTVAGYVDDKGGIWANEVRNIREEPLRVHIGKEHAFTGLWEEVKTRVPNAKFATSLYAMARVNGEYKLVNFKLSGCALGPWIDFVKELGGMGKLYDNTVVNVSGTVEGKKGKVTFNSPVFKVVSRELTPEASEKADDLDRELQAYLDEYFGRDKQAEQDPDLDAPEEEQEAVVEDYEGVPL